MKIDKRIIQPFLKLLRFFGLTLLFSLCFLSLIIGAYHFAYRGKIYPRVLFLGTDIGNRTISEANTVIKEKTLSYLEKDDQILLTGVDKVYSLRPSSIELSYDTEESAKQAFNVGRDGDLLSNSYKKLFAWRRGLGIFPVISYNKDKFLEQILTIEKEVNQPPIDSAIKVLPSDILVTESKEGKSLDRLKLLNELEQRFYTLSSEPIVIFEKTIQPKVTKKDAEEKKQEILNTLNKKITLQYGDRLWQIERSEIGSLISLSSEDTPDTKLGSFSLGSVRPSIFYVKQVKAENGAGDSRASVHLSQEGLDNLVKNIAKQIDVPAKNAVFQFSKGRVGIFQASSDGLNLNQSTLAQDISNNLLSEATSSSTINLQVEVKKPDITTEQVNNLGIKELLGRGVSYFSGSLPNREYNIQLGASKLHGILIPPGATFSFNDNLGEVSAETGYKTAYIIKDGKTDWGIGGGVCQISTTLFRAALYAGLPIVERHPHSYRVHYYEEGSIVGLDASVFAPSWDFKFKNDTTGYILIQAGFDNNKKLLVFELYGTSDGRVTTISKPTVTKQVAPPEPLYQDDPTLPKGQTKQVDFSAWGADVTVYRKVTRGEEVLQNDTIFSHYSAWKAIYMVGTQ